MSDPYSARGGFRSEETRADQTAHELFIAEEFIAHLARVEGVIAEALRAGDPSEGEPDAVCLVAGKPRGIELVDCWPSGKQAELTWDAALDAFHKGLRRMVASSSDLPAAAFEPHPSGDPLAATAEQRMRETMKAYGIPTWLLLNASQTIAPLHDERDGPWLAAQVRKPPRCAFAGVYLVLARSWAEGRRFFRLP